MQKKPIRIGIFNIENRITSVYINFAEYFSDGSHLIQRKDAADLGTCYSFYSPKPIKSAEYVEKVQCGILKNDSRFLFIITLNDGSVELIQAREGSNEVLALLQMSGYPVEYMSVGSLYSYGHGQSRSANPQTIYELDKNELPQGEYVIGRDIPPGTYDFSLKYGNSGSLEIYALDENGNRNYSTYSNYHVGLSEEYEHKEVVHVKCDLGHILKIRGNVVLKIARSMDPKIML